MASTMHALHNPAQPGPRQNLLLSGLPAKIFDGVTSRLEPVALPLGEVLHESGGLPHHAYFPTTAIASLSYVTENGASAEIASIGNEGMVGIPLFLGSHAMPNRATVCTGGYGYRIKAQSLLEEFNRAGPLMRLLLRYTQAFITQVAQTAVCNRHHSMEQQLCRWLLQAQDRLPSQELVMTQELIAGILGVRRESITEAAGNLQRLGLISYHRGHITVLDRNGLVAHTCECYHVVKREFEQLRGLS